MRKTTTRKESEPVDSSPAYPTIARVVDNTRMADGKLFSMPICLDVSEFTIDRAGLKPGARAALRDFRDDRNLAIITVEDVYKPDKYNLPRFLCLQASATDEDLQQNKRSRKGLWWRP